MTSTELEKVLPDVKNMLDSITSGNFYSYEKKLDKAAAEAIEMLTTLIADGTLALDPEQAVKAVQVLTRSKVEITESKRKLAETLIRGEVMLKALNQPNKGEKENSALLEYLEKNNLNKTLDSTGTSPGSTTSIFESIAANEVQSDNN